MDKHRLCSCWRITGSEGSYGWSDGIHLGGTYFRIDGADDNDYDHDIDTSNTINGRSIKYWNRASNMSLDASNAFTIVCAFCTNVEIGGGDLKNTQFGMSLYKTTDSTILHNTFEENSMGLRLVGSTNNIIKDNTFTHNGAYADLLLYPVSISSSGSDTLPSSGNTIYHNAFTTPTTPSRPTRISDRGTNTYGLDLPQGATGGRAMMNQAKGVQTATTIMFVIPPTRFPISTAILRSLRRSWSGIRGRVRGRGNL